MVACDSKVIRRVVTCDAHLRQCADHNARAVKRNAWFAAMFPKRRTDVGLSNSGKLLAFGSHAGDYTWYPGKMPTLSTDNLDDVGIGQLKELSVLDICAARVT